MSAHTINAPAPTAPQVRDSYAITYNAGGGDGEPKFWAQVTRATLAALAPSERDPHPVMPYMELTVRDSADPTDTHRAVVDGQLFHYDPAEGLAYLYAGSDYPEPGTRIVHVWADEVIHVSVP